MTPAINPFRFVWPVCRDGYVFEDAYWHNDGEFYIDAALVDENNKMEMQQLDTGGKFVTIRPAGDMRREYEPLIEFPGLYLTFAASVANRTGAEKFVNEFGLLAEGARLDNILRAAAVMRKIVGELNVGRREQAAKILNGNAHPYMLLKVDVIHAKTALEFIPRNLESAMFLQAAQAITKGTQFRNCRSCDAIIPFGPGTGNTARKEFCSDRCRVAFSRQLKVKKS